MAVDLQCTTCLKLWEAHGTAAAELRESAPDADSSEIKARLQSASQAIREHEAEYHPAIADPPV